MIGISIEVGRYCIKRVKRVKVWKIEDIGRIIWGVFCVNFMLIINNKIFLYYFIVD